MKRLLSNYEKITNRKFNISAVELSIKLMKVEPKL